ncbi:MAG: hypothetical protein AAFZ15_28085 [Bacteroidota bacterium]
MLHTKENEYQLTVKSKGLHQFRLNPFNALQLKVSAKPEDAVWQGEKLLSLARLGVQQGEGQLLSWMPVVDETEISKAMQVIEEPLQRLLEQLFWFDFEGDPDGALLWEGLAKKNGEKLYEYLEKTSIAVLSAPADQAETMGEEPENFTGQEEVDHGRLEEDEKKKISIAQFVNSANLDLLLGFSYFHGIGPIIESDDTEKEFADKKLPGLNWEKKGAVSQIVNPHKLIADVQAQMGREIKWPDLFSSAFQKWSSILSHPDFEAYVLKIIQNIDDDLLDESVVEFLINSIPTRLSDILVDELKELINQGQKEKTKKLLLIIAKSPFYNSGWKNNFHSLRHYYQVELSDLYKMSSSSQEEDARLLRIYFKRLEALNKRWRKIDSKGILGLNQLIEEAVLKAFNRITLLNHSQQNLEKILNLLDEATRVATERSLKNRIQQHKKKLIEYYEFNTCYYCGKRESDEKFPVIIRGRKETGRAYNTIYYSISYSIVARCLRCVKIHQFILQNGMWLAISFALSIILYCLSEIGFSVLFEDGALFGLLFMGGLFGYVIYFICYFFFKRIASTIITPRGEKKYHQIKGSKGYEELSRNLYGVENIDIDKFALKKARAKSKN